MPALRTPSVCGSINVVSHHLNAWWHGFKPDARPAESWSSGCRAVAARMLGACVLRTVVVVVPEIPSLAGLDELATARAERQAGGDHRLEPATACLVRSPVSALGGRPSTVPISLHC